MDKVRNAGILGTGSYVPEKVVTNDDLSAMMDTNDEWIVTRTGIRTRHVAASGEAASDMARQEEGLLKGQVFLQIRSVS